MLLLLRFIIVIAAARFRRPIGPLDESVVRYTVLPTDCDLNFHLNAGRFVSFMDVSRIELLARMRVLFQVLGRGWQPVIGGATIRYRRSILPFERFDVRSRVLGWDEKWFYIEHSIERDGNLCATAVMRTLLRRKGGTVRPEELLALTGNGQLQSPPLPPFVETWRASEDLR